MNLILTDMPVSTANKLTITGVATQGAKRFQINVGLDEKNIALHFDARFEYQGDIRTIVLECIRDGLSTFQKKEVHFLFYEGKEFKVTIGFTTDEFQITVPDDYPVSFPKKFANNEFTFIEVKGDMRIKNFNVE